MIGQTLLHYRIVEKIGEGGMGVVYKAVDTHLDRPVAIKILPPDKVADPERKRRFVLEAKAASALHHPNIVVIHDIASDRGVDFIVMEYVDGPSLDHIIGRRGMKLGPALGYAIQIADGLAKAHAAGIVHRDLKPTNVMVANAGGLVKILDFGLAKLAEPVAAAAGAQTMTIAQAEKPRTEEGFAVGTAAYMSPEQAEGGVVDARSDIFSFGVLLYEMLTGLRAFQRESRMKTLAAVLNDDPRPASDINEAVPAEVERLLARCLRKDPQRRWQTVSDLKVALQDLKEDSESGKLPAAGRADRASKRSPVFGLAVAGGALVFLAAAFVLLRPLFNKPAAAPTYETTRLTYDSGFTAMPALSPDGKMVAYVSDREGSGSLDLWVQQISGGKPLRLTQTPGNEWFPSFSADGTKIAFGSDHDGGGIFLVDALGGDARKIVDGAWILPRFSPDGSRLVLVKSPASQEGRLFDLAVVPAQGGVPRPVHPEFRVYDAIQGAAPVWSPDGKAVLINGALDADAASRDFWVIPVDGGEPVRTRALANLGLPTAVEYPALWMGTSVYFIYGTTIEGMNIYRASIDPKSYAISGPPAPVTAGPGMKIMLSGARDGRFAYSQTNASLDIWGAAARADEGTVAPDIRKLTGDTMQKFFPSVSRDGKQMAYIAFGGLQAARLEIRWRDLAGGRETVLPLRGQGLGFGQAPRLSPDGTALAYRDFIDGAQRTFLVAAGSTAGKDLGVIGRLIDFFADPAYALVGAEPTKLVKRNLRTGESTPLFTLGVGIMMDGSLSADNRWIALRRGLPDGRAAIEALPIGGGPAADKDLVTLAESERFLSNPRWSPDGRTVYYLSEESGRCGLYARGFDPRAGKPVGEARAVFFTIGERLGLNFPRGNGFIDVAADKIVFAVDEITSNIFLVTPVAR